MVLIYHNQIIFPQKYLLLLFFLLKIKYLSIHPLINLILACAEPSLDYFQDLKLYMYIFVVFDLFFSPQYQNIGLGGGGEEKKIY